MRITSSEPVSLYLHIPFCSRKCSYCAFYSSVASPDVIEGYVSALEKEILFHASYLDRPFSTVFIGGGNPGMLSSKQLLRLCKAACKNGKPFEFTIECNPESIRDDMQEIFSYVNRLSVGVQSLNADVLSFLGRNSSLEQTLSGINRVNVLKKDYGFSLNYDLITCVPHPAYDVCTDLEKLFCLSDFEHLSLYALTLENGTRLDKMCRKGMFRVLSDDEQADMLLKSWHFLKDKGFTHYEVSNFCLPGHECRHNLGYWNLSQYLGLGTAAASRLFSPYREVVNMQDIRCYIDSPEYCENVLSPAEELMEKILMAVRTKRGVVRSEIEKRFGIKVPGLSFEGFMDTGNAFIPLENGFLTADAAALYILNLLDRK